MFSFVHNEFRELVEMISVICEIAVGDNEDSVYLKLSPEMMSLMANRSSTTNCNISLQLFPPFFHQYNCNQTQYTWTYVRNLYPIMYHFSVQCGFTSLTFNLPLRNHSHLTFHSPNGRVCEDGFPLYPFDDSNDVGEFDLGTFVSIDSQYFLETIVPRFYVYDSVYVFASNSKVDFRRGETFLTVQISERCIIGGIGPTNEIVFIINLNSMPTFLNLLGKSKRIWLFKSASKTVMLFPVGLNARFLVYPSRIYQDIN